MTFARRHLPCMDINDHGVFFAGSHHKIPLMRNSLHSLDSKFKLGKQYYIFMLPSHSSAAELIRSCFGVKNINSSGFLRSECVVLSYLADESVKRCVFLN